MTNREDADKINAAYLFALIGALGAAGIPPTGIPWTMRQLGGSALPSNPKDALVFVRHARQLYDAEFGPTGG